MLCGEANTRGPHKLIFENMVSKCLSSLIAPWGKLVDIAFSMPLRTRLFSPNKLFISPHRFSFVAFPPCAIANGIISICWIPLGALQSPGIVAQHMFGQKSFDVFFTLCSFNVSSNALRNTQYALTMWSRFIFKQLISSSSSLMETAGKTIIACFFVFVSTCFWRSQYESWRFLSCFRALYCAIISFCVHSRCKWARAF